MNRLENLQGKRILFLQGPMGFFFKKLDRNFQKRGAFTHRIGFNMGDRIFSCHDNYTPYTDTPEQWESFITTFLDTHRIDMIFLFGDCRFYQRIARNVAYGKNIDVYVFEEGYIRPHYITMEKFGVNGFSHIPRHPSFYNNLPDIPIQKPKHAHTSKTVMTLSAAAYYAVANLFHFRYPYYVHHRDFSATKELFHGLRGILRKGIYKITERHYRTYITQTLSKQYYFIPLQTHNDFQILQHSHYRSIEKFIIEVLESFTHHAPKETYLVFKHHPIDRGRKNYTTFIKEQAKLLHIQNRVLVFHDVYLPDCLRHAKATITINSTVGLSAINHGTPTLTLGSAIYDIEGLTNHGKSLRKFWHQPAKPDMKLLEKFKHYLIENTQLNGSFYGKMPKELE